MRHGRNPKDWSENQKAQMIALVKVLEFLKEEIRFNAALRFKPYISEIVDVLDIPTLADLSCLKANLGMQ